MAKPSVRPRARREGLLVQGLAGETLVYDLERHRAYCLNPSMSRLWEGCDGAHTPAALVRDVAEAGWDADVVWFGLDRLGRARLLEERLTPPTGRPVSRRELTRRLGAALVLPLVASVVAPTPAMAATVDCLFDVEQGQLCRASQCGRRCGGRVLCGSTTFRVYCKHVGANYRCVPDRAGTCP